MDQIICCECTIGSNYQNVILPIHLTNTCLESTVYQTCTRLVGSIAANEIDCVPVLVEPFKENFVWAYCQTSGNNLF